MHRCIPPFLLILGALFTLLPCPLPASPAQGFGALSQGGTGGRILMVTRLDDPPGKLQKGTLRWALRRKEPRIVKFAVNGNIVLRDRIEVKQPCLTLDGSDAPGAGICIQGGSLEFKDTHDIIVRHIRIRLGDQSTLARNKAEGRKRPASSDGLDCITLADSRRILFDHCSLSWSCDEIFGITRCQDVTIQWCILGEPLSNPEIHPYGDHHAFVLNCSASTLSLHHCLLTRFHMRGPQFECNDMTSRTGYTVRMEAVNNVIHGYHRSGSRYSTGTEPGSGTSKGKSFRFQFLGNLYLPADAGRPAIEPFTKHGHAPDIQVGLAGNKILLPLRSKAAPDARPTATDPKGGIRPALSRAQETGSRSLLALLAHTQPLTLPSPLPMEMQPRRLFGAPVPVEVEPAEEAARRVLAEAGHRTPTDAVDARLLEDVLNLKFRDPLKSQSDTGGWPRLSGK